MCHSAATCGCRGHLRLCTRIADLTSSNTRPLPVLSGHLSAFAHSLPWRTSCGAHTALGSMCNWCSSSADLQPHVALGLGGEGVGAFRDRTTTPPPPPPTGALPAAHFAVQVHQRFVLMTVGMVMQRHIIGFDVYINVTQKSVLS